MDFIDSLAERNSIFAESAFKPDLKMMPSKGTIVIGCVDPRVDPAFILGLEQGEVAVIRNVGGRVSKTLMETLAVLRIVAKANGREGTRNIVLLHHTDCGIIGCHHLAPDLLARHMGVETAALDSLAIDNPYASVVCDIETLKANEQLPGDIVVTGLVYDVATGVLKIVAPPTQLRPSSADS